MLADVQMGVRGLLRRARGRPRRARGRVGERACLGARERGGDHRRDQHEHERDHRRGGALVPEDHRLQARPIRTHTASGCHDAAHPSRRPRAHPVALDRRAGSGARAAGRAPQPRFQRCRGVRDLHNTTIERFWRDRVRPRMPHMHPAARSRQSAPIVRICRLFPDDSACIRHRGPEPSLQMPAVQTVRPALPGAEVRPCAKAAPPPAARSRRRPPAGGRPPAAAAALSRRRLTLSRSP